MTTWTKECAGTGATSQPLELEVLVYNVEYGGDESTDEVIREIDADIVGVLETELAGSARPRRRPRPRGAAASSSSLTPTHAHT